MDMSFSFLKDSLQNCALWFKGVRYNSFDHLNRMAFDRWCETAKNVEVSIDTRTVEKGQLFIAFKGQQVDGHLFLKEAIEKGALTLVIDAVHESSFTNLPKTLTQEVVCFMVENSLNALKQLARAWRGKFTIPIVGITGSVGKTTTKEMVKAILETAGIVACVNSGTLNSDIGLSLSLLRLNEEHKIGIFEVGINHKGEMAELADILQPTLGLITNVAHVHVDGIGDLKSIAFEKRQLFKNFKEYDIGIIFGDHPLLAKEFYLHSVVKFGLQAKNQVRASKISIVEDAEHCLITNFSLSIYKDTISVSLEGNHKVYVLNALGAAAIATLLGICLKDIAAGLSQFKTFKNRFQLKKISQDRGLMVADCYNANPKSMCAALTTFHTMNQYPVKIAVLGDMLELGKRSLFWHRQIGRFFTKTLSIKKVILVGDFAQHMAKTLPPTIEIEVAGSWQEAQQKLEHLLGHTKALVLVKGSKGVGLAHMVQNLSV